VPSPPRKTRDGEAARFWGGQLFVLSRTKLSHYPGTGREIVSEFFTFRKVVMGCAILIRFTSTKGPVRGTKELKKKATGSSWRNARRKNRRSSKWVAPSFVRLSIRIGTRIAHSLRQP